MCRITQCMLDLNKLLVWAKVPIPFYRTIWFKITNRLLKITCFAINFLDRQDGLTVSSVIGDILK